jgi:hypothetical protein
MEEPIVADKPRKPLGYKGYGSTPHLVGSRVGPADHTIPPSQSLQFTVAAPRKGDRFIVTEKVDGSCVTAAKAGGRILPVTRAGYLASDSPWRLHHFFGRWVAQRESFYSELLNEGERVAGEWLYTAMGTRYHIVDPARLFVAFAILRGQDRIPFDEFAERCDRLGQLRAHVLSDGPPLPIPRAMELLGENGFHGALDGVEGAVWVHERRGKFSAIAKYVRPEKVDGKYIGSVTGQGDVDNYFGPAF